MPRRSRSAAASAPRALLAVALAAGLLLGCPRSAAAEGPAAAAAARPLWSERVRLDCGAEVFTIFGSPGEGPDVPFVSILNDTLGTEDPSDDQLRYVWVYSYCPPTVGQRVLASLPFAYFAFAGKGRTGGPGAPPVIFDFSKPADPVWKKIAWYAMQAAVLDPRGWVFQAGSRTYARNEAEYRQAHIQKGLSVISIYREAGGAIPPLEDDRDFELAYARLVENGFAGAFLNERHLADVYRDDTSASRERVGHNFELLRQRCEEQGLYFEALPGGGGRAEHAMVWVRRDDVERSRPGRDFDSRFLNIASPWSDSALRDWRGYSRVMFVSPAGPLAPAGSPGATPVEMIPLAIYGLDFPKIPALLVDFRSVFNPRRRELSRHAVDDVFRYILSATPVGDVQLFLAKHVYSVVTGRKGVDLYQPSRALNYAQLRTLMVLRDLFEPELREIVTRDLERLKANPLENGAEAERALARAQFDGLRRQIASGALDRRVERDRDRERARLEHGRAGSAMLRLASVASLGLYRHRDDGPESEARYALSRSMKRHRALLAEVAEAPRPIEVSWDPAKFRASLEFVAAHGDGGDDAVASAVERIFRGCETVEIRELAVDALRRIDSPLARRALDEIGRDRAVAASLRERARGGAIDVPVPAGADAAGTQ